MPRVALFCTNFLPYSQAFVFEQLKQYRRYEADVFCWRRFYPDRFPWQRVHQAGPSYVVTGQSRAFDRAFKNRRFDVVHAHFGPAGAYARSFAARHGAPLIVTFHGYDVPLLTSPRRFLPLHLPYTLGAQRMLREMSLGLCASSELRDMLRDRGVPESKLRVHRLGIDLDRFSAQTQAALPEVVVPKVVMPEVVMPEVVMIGRFVEKKGFEYGLAAFARVLNSGQRAHLTLIGDGERAGQLRKLVRRLGIRDAVSFTGPLSQADIAQRLARAQVLLAPSVTARDGNRESGLIVVKEASASGAVPVASRHGGIPESIEHGVTGFLVAERDVEGLAHRLLELLRNPELRRRMAEAGRRKMEREFDNRQLVGALEALYDETRQGFGTAVT